ncbi:MAG: endonuclease III [Candidatus Eisenbacteria bacterium]
MVTNRNIEEVLRVVRREIRRWEDPVVSRIAKEKRDPFRVLIGCLLSLRTKDETTAAACRRLFSLAGAPETLARLPLRTIEKAVFPVGFYRNKTRVIRDISKTLLRENGGAVPGTMEGLLALKGVGRKTANLVLTEGHGKLGICVDVHVHRITNRWGYVRTRTPDETEQALRAKLPKGHWKTINGILVTYGQNLCRPVSPHCSACKIAARCARAGVSRSR